MAHGSYIMVFLEYSASRSPFQLKENVNITTCCNAITSRRECVICVFERTILMEI